MNKPVRRIVLLVMVAIAAPSAMTAATSFEVNLQIKLGNDDGGPLGSLFEAVDGSGKVLFGAGFEDVYSTYIRDHNRQVVFYRRDTKSEPVITPLGKPFDPAHNGVRLIADSHNLLAFFRFYNPVRVLWLAAGDQWVPYDTLADKRFSRFGGLQYVSNQRMVFLPNRVLYDGRDIYRSRESGRHYYSNGRFYIFHDKPERLYVHEWNPASPKPIRLDRAKEWIIKGAGYPFIFGTFRDQVLMGTNIGNMFRFRDDRMDQIRESDGKSWQPYSVLNFNGQLAIGHYPTGSLYAYDGESLAPFKPPIPVPSKASSRAREAQTLAIHQGDLYAGVWPWGELWRFDSEARQWTLVQRLFGSPKVSRESNEPFARQMQGKSGDYNYWGQRITSLVNCGDALYIGTMNKRGRPFTDEHDFLDAKTVAQYGRVFRLRTGGQVAAPFRWQQETEFRFVARVGLLRVFQDSRLIAESVSRNFPGIDGGLNRLKLRQGKGVYGNFTRQIIDVKF